MIKELKEQMDYFMKDQDQQSTMITRIREKIEFHKAERSRSRSHGRAYYRGDARHGAIKSCLGIHGGHANQPNILIEANQNNSAFNSDFDPITAMFKTMEHTSIRSNDFHNRSEMVPFNKRVFVSEAATGGHQRQQTTATAAN